MDQREQARLLSQVDRLRGAADACSEAGLHDAAEVILGGAQSIRVLLTRLLKVAKAAQSNTVEPPPADKPGG